MRRITPLLKSAYPLEHRVPQKKAYFAYAPTLCDDGPSGSLQGAVQIESSYIAIVCN